MNKVMLPFLQTTALQAGQVIRKNFAKLSEAEWKEDNTPLTKIDTDINALVLKAVKEQYPEASVLSEEGSHMVEGSHWTFVCDPCDGTFMLDLEVPVITFCFAALYKGEPWFAVIYDALHYKMYIAEKNGGAFLNNKRIHVSSHEKMDMKMQVSILWWKQAQFDFSPLLDNLVKAGVPWINLCSIGYTAALIAKGKNLVSVYPGNKVWEAAAISLLVREAGGQYTDIFGNDIDYLNNGAMKGHLATNGDVHDEMLALIQQSLAK